MLHGYSPDGAEDGIYIWVPLILGPQQENILCFMLKKESPLERVFLCSKMRECVLLCICCVQECMLT